MSNSVIYEKEQESDYFKKKKKRARDKESRQLLPLTGTAGVIVGVPP